MAKTYDDEEGVWRTIGGRRVFIRSGQSLADAMIESGKFKTGLRSNYRKAKQEDEEKKKAEQVKNINVDDAINEFMNADVGDWNNMNQAERDKTCEKILKDFEQKYGDKLEDEKFRKEVLDGLEDQNFHTMGKIIDEKYEYSNNKELKDLDKRIAEAEKKEEKSNIWEKQEDGSFKANKDAMKKDYEERHKRYDAKIAQFAEDRKNMTNSDWEASIMAYEKQNADGTYNTFGDIYEDIEEYERQKSGNINNEYTKQELKDKYGTDDVDLINAGKEKENRVGLKKETNWRDQVKANNEQLEKDLARYKETHNMAYQDDGYYELFRENERKNAKIKQELPDEKYEPLEAYATYKEKRDKLEPRTEDGGWKDSTWTGKEYTNDEFMENLEDENWHTERKMLLDANLTNKQMEFVKNNTTFHNGSPSLDKEITEELIKGAKGEKYKTPEEIKSARKRDEIGKLEQELDIVSKGGRYDENGNRREGVSEWGDYSSQKERYKQLTGKDFDDSKVKIPYDPKKTYSYPNGLKIDQDLMKDRYSGKDPEDVLHDIEFNKKYLMNYNPKERELHNAEIKEMEKYYNSMEKYESRISDDFDTKDWKEGYGNQFGEGSWKGSKSDSGLYGKDKIKAIDDEIKKAYPEITTSRKTHQGGYTDSFSLNVMSSTKPIVRDISDFSDTEINRLYNSGYNKNTYKTVDEFKDHLKEELSRGHFSVGGSIKDDYRLTPFGKQLFRDINKVSNAYNYDESASQVDYFHTGHYMSLGVGKDGKDFELKKENNINDTLRRKGYQKYLKEHPGSKISFEEYQNKK